MTGPGILATIFIIVGVVILFRHLERRGGKSVCSDCGTIAVPRVKAKGSLLIEIVLWLCLILPGLIYSLWRISNKIRLCPGCGHETTIPIETPRGRELVARFAVTPPA